MLSATVREYKLDISIVHIPSESNRADSLMRVPLQWVTGERHMEVEGHANASVKELPTNDDIHHTAGHLGIRRTLFFMRRVRPSATKCEARDVVEWCKDCARIDMASKKWTQGSISVEKTWDRLAMDITHVGHDDYLSVIDCGPSRYTIWEQLGRTTSANIIKVLHRIFLE